jgi:hypothetical protein
LPSGEFEALQAVETQGCLGVEAGDVISGNQEIRKQNELQPIGYFVCVHRLQKKKRNKHSCTINQETTKSPTSLKIIVNWACMANETLDIWLGG